METRKHFIGELDFDYEPCGMPLWDLSGLSRACPIGGFTPEIEPVELEVNAEESVVITRPLSQLVDYYDRLVYPGYWNWCSD